MKTRFIFFIALLALTACNSNKGEVEKLKAQVNQDSVIIAQGKEKDSTIASYTDAMNQIQQKLDSIKIREKMVSTGNMSENGMGKRGATSITNDISSLDALIIQYEKQITSLASRLKKSERKDANMEKIVADLGQQLTGKEAEITAVQTRLSLTSDSVKSITRRFNDSLTVIQSQRAAIYNLVTLSNTVYYVIGTNKELEKKGIIDKTGGFIGIGRTKQINPNIDNSMFTQADKTTLSYIPLPGKFKSLITQHGGGTFRVSGKGKADTLLILDPVFWTDSKYAVISIK